MRTYYIWFDEIGQQPHAASRSPYSDRRPLAWLGEDVETVRAATIREAWALARRRYTRETTATTLADAGLHPHDAAELAGLVD